MRYIFFLIVLLFFSLFCFRANAQQAPKGAIAAVYWACSEIEPVADIVSSKTEKTYTLTVLLYVQKGVCVSYGEPMPVVLDEFQMPIKGGFGGAGEIWSIQTLSDQEVYIAIQINSNIQNHV